MRGGDAQDLYIAVSDRWLPEISAEVASHAFARSAAMHEGRERLEMPASGIPSYLLDPNTSVAD